MVKNDRRGDYRNRAADGKTLLSTFTLWLRSASVGVQLSGGIGNFMSDLGAPRYFSRGLGSALRTARYDLAFVHLGTGFILSEGGRLFVPLLGRPRMVPSPQEEMRWAAAWPKWWHAVGIVFVSMLLSGIHYNGAALLGPWTRALLFPAVTIAVLVLWLWRERRLTAPWSPVEAHADRTALVLSFLSDLSTLRLLAHLGSLLAFAVIVLQPWNLLRWPFVPSISQIGIAVWLQQWVAGALLALFVFMLFRAAYWAMRALLNRWLLAGRAA